MNVCGSRYRSPLLISPPRSTRRFMYSSGMVMSDSLVVNGECSSAKNIPACLPVSRCLNCRPRRPSLLIAKRIRPPEAGKFEHGPSNVGDVVFGAAPKKSLDEHDAFEVRLFSLATEKLHVPVTRRQMGDPQSTMLKDLNAGHDETAKSALTGLNVELSDFFSW
jgi:hypothetical protein